MSKIIPVILCGGDGARLWPLSQRERPKIFFEMADGRTLLRHAVDRARLFTAEGPVLTITTEMNAERISDDTEQHSGQGEPLVNLIEPCRCNTGPALATAALWAAQTHGEDCVVLGLPADHLIADEAVLSEQVREAQAIAEHGKIVIFGVKPDAAATSYGYIEHDLGDVRAFHEKPDALTAQSYLATGRFLWNAGIVVAKAGTLIGALERHAPQLLDQCRIALDGARAGDHGLMLDRVAYERCPFVSFDHAVLERADNVHVLQARFDWQDVGNWEQLGQMVPPDLDGNHVSGNAILFATNNCIVQAGQRPVGIVGLDNIVVVDSPDGLLVVHADAVEQVKSLFDNVPVPTSVEPASALAGFSETAVGAFQEKP